MDNGTKKLGLIGCGNIGSSVAQRLLHCKHKVLAYDKDEKKLSALSNNSLEAAANLKEVTDVCDIILLCLPSGDEAINTLHDSLVPHLSEQHQIVQLGACSEAASRKFNAVITEKGAQYAESIIAEGPISVLSGDCPLLFAGSQELYSLLAFALKDIGHLVYIGSEAGQAAVVNSAMLVHLYGVFHSYATACAMIEEHDLSVATYNTFIKKGLICDHSSLLTGFLWPQRFNKREFPSEGPLRRKNAITLNELKMSLNAAKSKNIQSSLIEGMLEVHKKVAAKNPDLDWTAIYDEINPNGEDEASDISKSDKKIFENLLAAKDKTPDYDSNTSIEAFVKQPALVISSELSLVVAAKQLASKKISEAIFADAKGNYMGVVSLTEIIRKMIIDEGSLSSKVSGDIVKKVPAIPVDTSPRDGLKILDKFEVGLFVVQKNSRILGVVNQSDLIKSIIAKDNITSKAS